MNDLFFILVGAFSVIAILVLMCWGILMLKKSILPKTTVEQEEEPTETITPEKMPYTAAKLLTKREYAFFMKLRPIAQKYNLMICPKIRLAIRQWDEDLEKIICKELNITPTDAFSKAL